MSVPPILKDLISKTTQWGNDVFPRLSQAKRKSGDQRDTSDCIRTRCNTSHEFWRNFDQQQSYSFSQPSLMDVRTDGDSQEESDTKPESYDKTRSFASKDRSCPGESTLETIWTFYALESTCHGLNNVANTYRRKWLRCAWLIVVVAMLAILVATVFTLFDDYRQNKTVTRTDVRVQSKPHFPSVTFCNLCPYKNINRTQDNPMFFLAAQTSLIHEQFPMNYSDPELQSLMTKSSLEVIDAFSFTKKDMFQFGSYEGRPLDVERDLEITDTESGRCFTFNGPGFVSSHDIRRVNFDGRNSGLRIVINIRQDMYMAYEGLTAGVRVFVSHHPETARLEKDGLDIHPGTSTRIALSPEKFQFLPHPFSSYGSEYCLDTTKHDLRNKMVNAPFYSRNSCILQCHSLKASMMCSCYSRALYVASLPPCTFEQYIYCLRVKLGDIKAGRVNASCDCPRPCTFTRYNSIMSSSQLPSKTSLPYLNTVVNASSIAEIRENFLEVRVFLDSMLIRMERHEAQYTLGSIFGFLGGQMGFFMGASLMTIAELGEALFFTLLYLIHKLCNIGRMKTPDTSSNGK